MLYGKESRDRKAEQAGDLLATSIVESNAMTQKAVSQSL